MSISVLIVDDSAVVRRILSNALEEEPDFVVHTARDGKAGLEAIARQAPDVVVLDVEMPELDGLATLRAMRERNVRIPVVMFSSLTAAGSAATVEALSLGAADYVTKPTGAGSLASSIAEIRDALVPRIRALCRRPAGSTPRPVVVPRPVRPTSSRARVEPVEIVVIGVSTGGPQALAALVPQLPGNLRVPVCIVQHMPPTFTTHLARRLDSLAPLTVIESEGGETLTPGTVYLAPGGHHLRLDRRGPSVVTRLGDEPPENSCRPAVDPLFRDAAARYGGGVLAVVLTGMGHDGRDGAEQVQAAGGHVIAQDEVSSVVWGMPGAVVQAGLADSILPLDRVASEITQRVAAAPRVHEVAR